MEPASDGLRAPGLMAPPIDIESGGAATLAHGEAPERTGLRKLTNRESDSFFIDGSYTATKMSAFYPATTTIYILLMMG